MNVALQQNPAPEDRMVDLPSGPMRVRLHGNQKQLAIGVPGLSANALSFDALGGALALKGMGLAAVDLRGRGRSPAGRTGSHGWQNHARDVLAMADALGADKFDFVGHSMGAFVGLTLANLAPQRLRKLVLIDAIGVPDPRAMPPIFAAAMRLGAVYPSADDFLEKVKAAGTVPWSPFWEAHYREDLVEVPGGVEQRASRVAVLEDVTYAATSNVRQLWPGVTAPALLIRAGISLGPGGDIVTLDDRDGFVAAAKQARAVEINANHYGLMNHPKTATVVEEFLK